MKQIALFIALISFSFTSCEGWIPQPAQPAQGTNLDLSDQMVYSGGVQFLKGYSYKCYTYQKVGTSATVKIWYVSFIWNAAGKRYDEIPGSGYWRDFKVNFGGLNDLPGRDVSESIEDLYESQLSNGSGQILPMYFTSEVTFDNVSNANILNANGFQGLYP